MRTRNPVVSAEAEANTAAEETIVDVVVANIVAVVDIRMFVKTKMDSPRPETSQSPEEEEVENIAAVVASVMAPLAKDSAVSTVVSEETVVEATAPVRKELLSRLSNNSKHNNE